MNANLPKKLNFNMDKSSPNGVARLPGADFVPQAENVQSFSSSKDISVSDSKLSKLNANFDKTSKDIEDTLQPSKKINKFLNPDDLLRRFDFIKPGFVVVEFGCGFGSITIELASLHKGATFYGVDVQKDLLIKMLSEAKARGIENIKAVWGDLDTEAGAKLTDASADLVFFVNSLYQMENKKQALLEARRILKTQSYLLVVDWDENASAGPPQGMRITRSELLTLAQDAGFVFSSEKELDSEHYMLIFIKQ